MPMISIQRIEESNDEGRRELKNLSGGREKNGK